MGISLGWVVRLSVFGGTLLLSRVGCAQDTMCDRSRSHVTVAFEGSFPSSVRDGVLSDLSAALAPRELSACFHDPSHSDNRISGILLTQLASDRVRIEVDDRLTNKRVSRDVLLRDSSDGASSLVLAVAADELLRATWAELTLREAAPPAPSEEPMEEEVAPRASPPTEEPVLGKQREERPLPRLRTGLQGSTDLYLSGSPFFGADAFVGSEIGNLVEWTFAVGPRFSRTNASSPLGGVHADALAFGLGIHVPVFRKGALVLGPSASVQGFLGWFEGKPDTEDAVASSTARGWALSLRGGITARVFISKVFVRLYSECGGTPRGYEVTDGRGVIGGMTGVVWSSGIGLGRAFEW